MTIYHYDVSEWYPVFSLLPATDRGYTDKTAEFTDEEVARINAANEEFDATQQLIEEKFELLRERLK
jgi:hypothetical protein